MGDTYKCAMECLEEMSYADMLNFASRVATKLTELDERTIASAIASAAITYMGHEREGKHLNKAVKVACAPPALFSPVLGNNI